MSVRVCFYSYCRELAGCAETVETVSAGESIADLLSRVFLRFPKMASMKRSLLVAVGVDYQTEDYVLQDGDEVALFPPVQGG